MQVNIQGLLVDPSGNTLPNHDIRITSKDDLLNSIETTDGNGNYSFILSEGWHYVEVLFKGKYLIVGDLLVDGSTPSPITLNDLLKYSTPIEPDDINDLPVEYQSLQDSLENSALTQYREQRSQLVNPVTHKVRLVKAYESDDGNERSMVELEDLTSCDATIQTQNQVYTDSEGNTYSVTGSKQATKHVVKLDSVLLTDEYDEKHSITLGTYTDTNTKLITPTGSVTTVSLSKGGTSKLKVETINESGVSSNTNTTSALGTLTENQSVLNSQLNLSKSFEELYKDSFTYDGLTSTKEYSSIIEDKEVSVTFTNTGSSTQGAVIADNFTIGREGNRTFEVDSINDRVTVRGTLRISDLEDEDGNPIDIPEDGDTIFQVFQYSETSTGPWEDVLQSYHIWKRENTSVNGVVDPTSWSTPYKFVGGDGIGEAGDTIFIEYQYSPDGSIDWTETMKAGDAFRRERTVINGIAEEWSDPVRIKGTDGDEIEIRSQYSVDGISNWHNTFVDGDIFERRARFVNGLINSSWSDPFKVVATEVFKSTVFTRSDGQPSIPEGGSWANPIPTTVGWSDGIPTGEFQLWASTRIFTLDGSGKQQDSWTTPNAISDTATIDYEFSSIEENPGDPTNNPSNWHNTAVPSDIWMSTRVKTNGIFRSWEIVKIKGEDGLDGDTIYEVYQYSVDGSTNWHDDYTTGDIYRRAATVTNGVRGLWRDLSRITGVTPEIISNPDGSYTITNGTETATIYDGENAPIPTVTKDGDTVTIESDGETVTISDGAAGHTPIKGIDYIDGKDGSFVSNIYKTSSTGISSSPTGGTFNGTIETFPSGWQDTPYFEEGKVTYISTTRYRQQENGSWLKDGWSSPAEYIIKGDKGPQGVAGKDGAKGPQGVQGPIGPQGEATYTWIRYADTVTGTGISNNPTGKEYIGFAYNKTTATESTKPADYSWSLIKGTDGVKGDTGEDGKTTYTWIAYSDNANGSGMYQVPNSNTKYIGIAVNKTTAIESTNQADYTWSLFKGADGETTYTWIRYADSASGGGISNSPTNKEYIGFAYNKTTPMETNIPTDYTWSLIKGTDGVKGDTGEDGTTYYTWIAYSNFADGTNLYQTPNSNTLYIGIAPNKLTPTESNVKGDYTWSRFKGDKGDVPIITTNQDGSYTISNGIDSVTITDGTAAPIPTAVDNGNGTYTITDGSGNSVTVSNGENGYTPVKGIDYFDGLDGSFVSNVYKTSSTGIPDLPTGGSFDGSTETIPSGGYQDKPYFEEGKVTYTSTTRYSQQEDGSWVKSGWSEPSPYIIKGDEGPQGVAGQDGEDGTTTYTWIRYADVAEGEGISNDPTGKTYIGLAYNQTSPIELNDPDLYTWSLIKGTDGVKGDTGEDGKTTYTWIAYSDFSDGTDLYQEPNSNTLYIGIAPNKLNPEESSVKGDYTWSRFKGEQGESAFTNLTRSEGQWVVGTSGAQGVFEVRGTDSQNRIISAEGPEGTIEPIWEGSGADTYAAGGFYVPACMDINKSYRYSVWIKEDANNDHLIYWGPPRDYVTAVPGNTASSNPYFIWGTNLPTPNKWYLAVGILHASSYTGGISGLSGIYDPDTGELVYTSGIEYKGATQQSDQGMRVFRYAAETATTKAYFCRPRIEEINGEEMSLGALMGRIPKDGADGSDGIPGLNGSGWYSIVGNGGVWPGDTQATADFINTFGRVPQLDDHLFYVDQDPDPTKTEGRRCITEVGEDPIQWNNPRAYFDGDVIVKGTLSADRLVAQSITGNEIDSQTTIIAGSGSSTAGINGYDLSALPDWMGGGSNPYAGYRFWAGSTTPEFANFTVDDTGKMKAVNGEFSGTLDVKSGTSGARTEITESLIKVYNSSNNLIVRIGVW